MKKLSIVLLLLCMIMGSFAIADSNDSKALSDLLNSIPNMSSQQVDSSELSKFRQDFEKKQDAVLKADYQKAVDGSLFSNLGKIKLYKADYKYLNGRQFNVYTFSKQNESVIWEIIDAQTDERYFSATQQQDDGVDYVQLKQFGSDGKYMILSLNHPDSFVVMVEKGLAVDGYHFPEVCTTCNKSGDCGKCNNGTCNNCDGVGYKICIWCDGTKIHSSCDGTGYKYFSSLGKRDCWCDDGACTSCDGTGLGTECYYCNGSGDCDECNGKGRCLDCNGAGVI